MFVIGHYLYPLVSRARDGKEVGNLGGSKTFTKKKKTGGGTYGTNLDEETNTVEAEGIRLLHTTHTRFCFKVLISMHVT